MGLIQHKPLLAVSFALSLFLHFKLINRSHLLHYFQVEKNKVRAEIGNLYIMSS